MQPYLKSLTLLLSFSDIRLQVLRIDQIWPGRIVSIYASLKPWRTPICRNSQATRQHGNKVVGQGELMWAKVSQALQQC